MYELTMQPAMVKSCKGELLKRKEGDTPEK